MSLDISNIKEIIQDHMEGQPYKITCGECGSDIDFEATIDKDFDLAIKVFRCSCSVEKE